jgi:Dyp-type peroxidase family
VTGPEPLELHDMQGLVVRGYGSLPYATFLLLHVVDGAAASSLVGRWADVVTSGALSPPPPGSAMNVALTAEGVDRLTAGRAPSGFSEQFVTGMASTYRSRLLGDVDDDAPRTWRWGGPGTEPVHVLVLLYAVTPAELSRGVASVTADAAAYGLKVVAQLDAAELQVNEPFGFHDGISQPLMAGLPKAGPGGDVVRAGEFVLGYRNEYGQRTERPLVPASSDPGRLLPPDADGSGAADVGRNGTYLVVRQLEQDVDGFWDWVGRASARPDGTVDQAARTRLAAKMVGRWPSGAPLVLTPEADDPAQASANDFRYHATDPAGLACPIGAHVRRANPRDALEPHPGSADSLAVNRKHRIIRRGRGYRTDTERGLYFMCLNGNLARQFEFIQHSWVNDPYFNLLDDATDPVCGVRHDGGTSFTAPGLPVRTRYQGLPQFVHVRGGAYFFLPGIGALRYLASRGLG